MIIIFFCTFQINVLGSVGASYEADIALDDFSLAGSSCNTGES